MQCPRKYPRNTVFTLPWPWRAQTDRQTHTHTHTHTQSTHPPLALACSTASSMSLAYSGFCDACRMSDGFVVASVGLYFFMADQIENTTDSFINRINFFMGDRSIKTLPIVLSTILISLRLVICHCAKSN